MVKRMEGTTEKLLEYAKLEFLEKGYENASLRNIAKNAGSSKGAIYVRYPDKDSLFEAVVKPAMDELLEFTRNIFGDFSSLEGEEQQKRMAEVADKNFSLFIDCIYDNFDTFTLLVHSSNKSIYTEFIHKLVDLEVQHTYKYIEAIGNDAVVSGRLTEDFAHLVTQSFFAGVFEVVLHKMSKRDAIQHIDRLRAFYSKGWETIFNG